MPEKRERITAYVTAELIDDLETLVFSLRRHGIKATKSDLVAAAIKAAIADYGKLGENSNVLVALRGQP